jgi:cyclic-di-GMP phosphodiesterase, flagellum assembly factor TipF
LIAERIEGERAVVDLLDYDVRFGQGFLFAPPRPLRAEGGANGHQEQLAPIETPAAVEPPPRATGNAALARRVAGPG